MARRAPKKAGKKDQPGAGVGHNKPPELSTDERQALHLNQHVPAYERAMNAKKAAASEFGRVCKLIKSEGGSAAKCKLTLALRTHEGEEAFRARMAEEAEIARWSGVAVQTEMFDDSMVPADDKAYEAGKRHGLAGDRPNNPYHHTLSQHAKYESGYSDGNQVLARASFKTRPPDDLPRGSAPKAVDSFDDAIDAANLEEDTDMVPLAGEMVSRAEFNRRMAENHKAADDLLKATA